MTGVVSARTSFGSLGVQALDFFDLSQQPGASNLYAGSYFTDVLTIDYAPWNGSPGLLYVGVDLDGVIKTSGIGRAALFVGMGGGVNNQFEQGWSQTFLSSTTGRFSFIQPLRFTYGQPFALSLSMTVRSGTFDYNTQQFYNSMGAGSGVADFLHTMILSELRPTNLSGTDATDPAFSSLSGTNYSRNGVIPEPSSQVLIFFGLISILGIRAMTSKPWRLLWRVHRESVHSHLK